MLLFQQGGRGYPADKEFVWQTQAGMSHCASSTAQALHTQVNCDVGHQLPDVLWLFSRITTIAGMDSLRNPTAGCLDGMFVFLNTKKILVHEMPYGAREDA